MKNNKFKIKLTRALSGALLVCTLVTANGCAKEVETREITAQELEHADNHDDKFGILVNKENAISQNQIKNIDLVKTKDVNGKDVYLQRDALNAFNALKAELAKNNHRIEINTAFRTYEDQEAIYNELLAEHGKEYADKYAAPVGYSEHHTGLAIDVYMDRSFILGKQIPLQVNPKYQATKKALYETMANYGFILRYPEGKEEVTGYPEEAWHIRYVGKELAKLLTEKNLTLEEYYEALYQYKNGAVNETEEEMGA